MSLQVEAPRQIGKRAKRVTSPVTEYTHCTHLFMYCLNTLGLVVLAPPASFPSTCLFCGNIRLASVSKGLFRYHGVAASRSPLCFRSLRNLAWQP